MPGAVAQAGLCHAVLPLPRSPRKLLELLRKGPRMSAALCRCRVRACWPSLLKARSGLMIGQDKIYLLETRLAPILKREKLRDLNGLAERLRGRGADALAREVVEAMTTNESFFFRDDKPFQHFRTQALPRLHRRAPAGHAAAHLVGGGVVRAGGLFAGDDPGRDPRRAGRPAQLRSSAPTSRATSWPARGTGSTPSSKCSAACRCRC